MKMETSETTSTTSAKEERHSSSAEYSHKTDTTQEDRDYTVKLLRRHSLAEVIESKKKPCGKK